MVGILGNIASSFVNLPSLVRVLINMFHSLQYLAFLIFMNTELPPACDDFIATLFESTVSLGSLLSSLIVKLYQNKIGFSQEFDLEVVCLSDLTSRLRPNSKRRAYAICSF